MANLRITVLAENTVRKKGILAEHGFALWIELGDKRILFDTGQGKVIHNNAINLGINLGDADSVALSHGHYDHTGGLVEICRQTEKLTVYSHPAVFNPKYSKHVDGSVHDAGISTSAKNAVSHKTDVRFNNQSVEICPGFHLTGEIPRITDFEDTGGAFFLDHNCKTPDLLIDDQAAFINTSSGLIVILGCAHAGVINTLRHIRQLTGICPIHTVIGGMHLVSATNERIDKTIMEFKDLGIKRLFPAHCTGFEATARLWREFRELCSPCNVGTVIEMKV